MRRTGILLLFALVACGRGPDGRTAGQPLAIRIVPAGDSSRLVLTAAAGWRIGARLKPAIETPEGAVLRFDSPRLTPDSAYFAEPPTATVPGRLAVVRGTLRASLCGAGERVCRVVTMAVRSER